MHKENDNSGVLSKFKSTSTHITAVKSIEDQYYTFRIRFYEYQPTSTKFVKGDWRTQTDTHTKHGDVISLLFLLGEETALGFGGL